MEQVNRNKRVFDTYQNWGIFFLIGDHLYASFFPVGMVGGYGKKGKGEKFW